MKIVVTGGAGFIGSHLVDKLISLGHQVTIIDNLITGSKGNINKKAEFYDLDIKDEKIGKVFSEFKPEAVFHLAGQTSVKASLMNPSFDADENIYGTLNILEVAKKYNIEKFIFASTAAIYGDVKNLPVEEEENAQPISFYGLSKSFAE
ncbi:MAG: GDP-mannose 4,6-dehydratase, partial [Actinomycetia bacterium]|nr:GDP-mannose 4,6-dehydratase [Actinomycetes bacterium]